jgi:hypothetical protein
LSGTVRRNLQATIIHRSKDSLVNGVGKTTRERAREMGNLDMRGWWVVGAHAWAKDKKNTSHKDRDRGHVRRRWYL